MVLGFAERQFCGKMENVLLLLYQRFMYTNRLLANLSGLKDLKSIYIKGIMNIEKKVASKIINFLNMFKSGICLVDGFSVE